MFEPPKIIETTVFARLPDKYRLTGKQTDWLKVQRRGENLHSFLEGPSFDRAGNLYVVDVPFGRIFRISPDGIFNIVIEYDGEPNGLKIHPDGRIFIADHKNGILTLDPGSGALSPVVDRDAIEDFKGPNDLVFSSTGDLYFTDQGQTGMQDPAGRVYRLRANGTLEKILEGIPSPNGIVLDNKETAILIAVTRGNAVWRAPMLLDGSVSKVGIFIQMSGGVGPDGMAIDEAGNLAVCHPGMGATWLFSAAGEPLYRIRSCADNFPTNCAFGGPDRRSLFIVESHSGSILRAELPTPGRKMFSHS
jgi:gluconolactonase